MDTENKYSLLRQCLSYWFYLRFLDCLFDFFCQRSFRSPFECAQIAVARLNVHGKNRQPKKKEKQQAS